MRWSKGFATLNLHEKYWDIRIVRVGIGGQAQVFGLQKEKNQKCKKKKNICPLDKSRRKKVFLDGVIYIYV